MGNQYARLSVLGKETGRVPKFEERGLPQLWVNHEETIRHFGDFQWYRQAAQLVPKKPGRAEEQHVGVRQLLPLQLAAANHRHGGMVRAEPLPQQEHGVDVSYGGVVMHGPAFAAAECFADGTELRRFQQIVRFFDGEIAVQRPVLKLKKERV